MTFTGFTYYDFIELLAVLYKPQSYLGLGVDLGECFKRMEQLVPKATAVDIRQRFFPEKGTFFHGTTSQFFEQNEDLWDMIFIDACHAIDYVRSDLENSLKVLSKKGICILHDTDPESVDLIDSIHCHNSYKIVDEIDTNKYFTFTFPTNNSGITILTLKSNRRCLEFV
ncbi:MAG: hypothetical protein DRO67_09565 [Candidatus Asgardarchaeum californiense]|nr:MAG: hypothetical protein DRO67_09565 [Candidatus Asgardarchaeum californiense]